MPVMPVVRLSGLLAARPAANTAKGARFLATDTGLITFSTGTDWQDSFELEHREAIGIISDLLSSRPTPRTCVGWLFIDEAGNQYEAFPGGWALVNQVNLS